MFQIRNFGYKKGYKNKIMCELYILFFYILSLVWCIKFKCEMAPLPTSHCELSAFVCRINEETNRQWSEKYFFCFSELQHQPHSTWQDINPFGIRRRLLHFKKTRRCVCDFNLILNISLWQNFPWMRKNEKKKI